MAATRNRLTPAILAGFAVPGLGHLLLKRKGHGTLFAICVYGLFAAGMIMSGMTAIDPEHHPVYWWLAQFAAGIPAWVVHWGGLAKEPLIGETVSIGGQMYGLTYVCVAGLINLLSLIELARHSSPAPETSSTEGAKA
ncbi:MAG: hypothetical protein L6Q71_11660 [Planctomycetes bacterium]|nr:hypothetical protein [Planctomycetota bacterium]